jgi:glycosyltransferase involved in cell wall biosynthesis
MKVSVIIPNYNTAHYIEAAIESVLASQGADFEVIVVDDGSSDRSREVLAGYEADPRIRCIFQQNKGLAGARNTGIKAATGDYLVFLDSDDLVLPEKLALQAGYLDAHPEYEAVYSRSVCFVEDDPEELVPVNFPVYVGDIQDNLLYGNFIHVNSVMVRRMTVLDAGLFAEEFRELEDWDLWLRLSLRGGLFGFQDQVLSKVRLRKGSMTTQQERMNRTMLRVLEKHIAGMKTAARPIARLTWVKAYRALFMYRIIVGDTHRFFRELGKILWRLGLVFVYPALRLTARLLVNRIAPGTNKTTQAFEQVWKS